MENDSNKEMYFALDNKDLAKLIDTLNEGVERARIIKEICDNTFNVIEIQ